MGGGNPERRVWLPKPLKTSHRNCWKIAFKLVVLNVRYSQAEEHLKLI